MKHVYDDGGRAAAGFKGSADDCVCRAIAIATGTPYAEVYAAINDLALTERPGAKRRKGRRSSARTGVFKATTRKAMERFGGVWVPTMSIGSGCTVHLRDGELPSGRIIAAVSKHVVAVINGVIHDTHNPSERGTTIYPEGTTIPIPKGAQKVPSGWAYSPDRCVYGYWTFPDLLTQEQETR